MRIRIKHNLDDIPKELRKMAEKQVRAALFRATNETARRVRKTFSMEIRKRINLPASGKSDGGRGRRPPGVKDLLQVNMAQRPTRGAKLTSIFATIGSSSKPISLIHFVRGSKQPPRMAGIPAKRRRKVKVMVEKGKAGVRPKMFIQEAKGAVQVWRRHRRKGPDKMLKQATGSLFSLVNKRKIAAAVQVDAGKFLQDRFLHHLKFAAEGGSKARKPK